MYTSVGSITNLGPGTASHFTTDGREGLRAVKPEPRKISSDNGLKLVVFERRLLSIG